MKFYVFLVLLLCVYFGQVKLSSFIESSAFISTNNIQVRLESNELTDEKINELRGRIRDKINGVGDQFVADFINILEKYRNNSYVLQFTKYLVSDITYFFL